MAKNADPKSSLLLRTLREELVGPESGMDHFIKRVLVPASAADTLARLYAATGGKATPGEFLDVFLARALSKSDHQALATIAEGDVAVAKAKLFQVVERKADVPKSIPA